MKTKTIENITIPTPESYKDCILLAQSDYYRYTGKVTGLFGMLYYALGHPLFAFSFWLRMSSYKSPIPVWGGGINCFSRFCKIMIGRKRGLMISENMALGYGLYLSHGFGVVVNPSAVIGNNCTLSQFTTVGAVEGKAAIVGDNVYIGPSVCLVENVRIGNNSIIGAGAVVVKDVPNNSIVAGVPAKVIADSSCKKYINHPWAIK